MRKLLPYALFLVMASSATLPVSAAHYPAEREMELVEDLAEDLKKSSRYLFKDARHHADRHDYRERRALRHLKNLEEKAEEFECAVEESYGNPYKTERYFHDLYHAARLVEDSFHDLHHHDRLYKGFYEVKSLLSELSRYYGYPTKSYGERYRGHGRYRPYGRYRRGASFELEDRLHGRPDVAVRVKW